ncbi:Threonylcarbamoyl-AMP synthase [Phytophthora nicotianae]|uniref:Threonylcarbamoyl-AMP synthase n=1 Tax=Phytophthora nicotianae TaxID=4792 RepID=A0A0W8D7J2_PHYNI|nr:Threonylcarbamoyl-AMP synthase [Phytophthora nicotianae]
MAKRPRTRSSSWQDQEQNTFFTMFKVKWPPTPEGEPVPPFSSLLLQRFDAISTKVRTKSVMEVRQFYTTVMQNISELLKVVENDIDLTNPDQVRIAVWCWSKLMADKRHSEKFYSLDSEPATVKTNLATLLLQSIIRSRRQMLKAKSDSSNAPAPGLTSISAWVSRSNLSSFFAKGNAQLQRYQSRKKIYIKMRMVPRDKQTKADVVHCGCRPKVELKLSSTKKISEITAHMSKKWAKVRSLVPKGAMLCFFQKNGTERWSKDDSNVTCFDMWKQCGKQTNGENVVEVSYLWKVPEQVDDENVQVQELMPLLAPPGLFEQEVSTVKQSNDESETTQLSPARGLQEFGEKVAFDRSIADEAKEEAAALEALMSDSGDEGLGEEYSPNTGRLRRRIKPQLVSTEEFNI